MKHPIRTLISLTLFIASLASCAGKTGGDECESTDDCGGDGLQCLENFDGSDGGCVPNDQQPKSCATPCETDDDCASAEFGFNPAPSCLPDCSGAKICFPAPPES